MARIHDKNPEQRLLWIAPPWAGPAYMRPASESRTQPCTQSSRGAADAPVRRQKYGSRQDCMRGLQAGRSDNEMRPAQHWRPFAPARLATCDSRGSPGAAYVSLARAQGQARNLPARVCCRSTQVSAPSPRAPAAQLQGRVMAKPGPCQRGPISGAGARHTSAPRRTSLARGRRYAPAHSSYRHRQPGARVGTPGAPGILRSARGRRGTPARLGRARTAGTHTSGTARARSRQRPPAAARPCRSRTARPRRAGAAPPPRPAAACPCRPGCAPRRSQGRARAPRPTPARSRRRRRCPRRPRRRAQPRRRPETLRHHTPACCPRPPRR